MNTFVLEGVSLRTVFSIDCSSYLYQIAHLGDDDDEPEFSSAMPLEEGDTFFFAPRPLRNLVLVDELDSLSPILACQVADLGKFNFQIKCSVLVTNAENCRIRVNDDLPLVCVYEFIRIILKVLISLKLMCVLYLFLSVMCLTDVLFDLTAS
jgi:hypothetical protein